MTDWTVKTFDVLDWTESGPSQGPESNFSGSKNALLHFFLISRSLHTLQVTTPYTQRAWPRLQPSKQLSAAKKSFFFFFFFSEKNRSTNTFPLFCSRFQIENKRVNESDWVPGGDKHVDSPTMAALIRSSLRRVASANSTNLHPPPSPHCSGRRSSVCWLVPNAANWAVRVFGFPSLSLSRFFSPPASWKILLFEAAWAKSFFSRAPLGGEKGSRDEWREMIRLSFR